MVERKPGGSVAERRGEVQHARPIKGVPTRVLTISSRNQIVTISRSLVDVDRNLARLRWLLVFISLGGIGAAAILGALVSGRAVAPLRRLTETTERIVETGDLSERTGQRGRDEISRLSTRLDELLATLETSLRTQRQLVADASHELRTPIATLRANFELLADPGALEANERAELLGRRARTSSKSMTTLVGELVELARGEELDVVPREFRLDEVVQSVVDRAARRAPDLSFRTQLEPSVDRRGTGARRAGGLEPARQRPQVEPVRRDGRRRRPRRARRGARPRSRDRRRGPAARLQPLLPLGRRREGCRAPVSGSRSSSRSPTPTAAA